MVSTTTSATRRPRCFASSRAQFRWPTTRPPQLTVTPSVLSTKKAKSVNPTGWGRGLTVATRLLILACSQRKHVTPALLPALQRYDSPTFRLVRRYLASPAPTCPPPDIHILSAEFGLIEAHQPIPLYDRSMTRDRAVELGPVIWTRLADILESGTACDIFLSLSGHYASLFHEWESVIPVDAQVRLSSGPPGRRLAQLHDWLYGHAPVIEPNHGPAQLKNVAVDLEAEQVVLMAREALASRPAGAYGYQAWYVEVGGQRVGTKWLASLLTGLPVGAFRTSEAIRFLRRLGVEIKRLDDTGEHA